MLKIKNLRPGILIIPDAGLKLNPGQVAEIDEVTDQIKRCLSSGYVVHVDKENGIGDLNVADAITKIKSEKDVEKLKGYLGSEKRRSVIDTLKAHLAEVDSGS